MAKKTFGKGLDSLLAPSVPETKQPKTKPRVSAPVPPPVPASSADLVQILIRIPEDLKMKLDLHCVQNRQTKQDFIANLINKAINE